MLKDIRDIKICGANFDVPTQLPLFRKNTDPAKAVILYGRNGTGKSTIARAFDMVKGVPKENIYTVSLLDERGEVITLTEAEKDHIFVFDEDYITENVRVKEDNLGSIVMLGEQAGLTELIEAATEELRSVKTIVDQKKATLNEYNDPQNQNSPKFFINKMRTILQQNGWADRKRQIDEKRINASVNNDTYQKFLNLSPNKTRDELIVDFRNTLERLENAQSGVSKINLLVPSVPKEYINFKTDTGNQLLSQIIEHPELTKREQYLLELIHNGHGDELRNTALEFEDAELTLCPKCYQPISEDYKVDLIKSIQKVLSEEVKRHQNHLQEQILSEVKLDLDSFKNLPTYQKCVDQVVALNQRIQSNNELLQSKKADPYTPIISILLDISQEVSALSNALIQLDKDRQAHNRSVEDTGPIKEELARINDEIAYWDIIELSRQNDVKQVEKQNAENDYNQANKVYVEKQNHLNELNAQRDSINIAIDVINEGLKYIFFSGKRMQIHVEDGAYRLVCNGHPVKPKDISVGERNAIGLCYFFANVLEGKSRDAAYTEEYLLVIDDPVSSYDLENRVGVLSYLKLKLSKFFLGNIDTRALIMTHDLFTAIDIGKMYGELKNNSLQSFSGQEKFVCASKELSNKQLKQLKNDRNEYTILLSMVYEFANGGAAEHEIYIGNIIRQVLEAFSTFEFRKTIDKVSVDDDILSIMKHPEHRNYFKKLMYRLVLNEGSHKKDQTRNMQMDFFSVISEPDKRRTAKEILCFMELLNAPHVKAHLGADCANVIDGWCKDILNVEQT